MGIIHFGIPEQEARWLSEKLGLNIAVETGTYKGETAKLLAGIFETVYTIEKSDAMAAIARQHLQGVRNVNLLHGDTRDHLPTIVTRSDHILFWLDAHWCGGQTYGVEDECPLVEELDIIFQANLSNYAILIDDARLFTAPPPLPHHYRHWPTLKDIISTVPKGFEVMIHDDVIYTVPHREDIADYMRERNRLALIDYTQLRAFANRAHLLRKIARIRHMFKPSKLRSRKT